MARNNRTKRVYNTSVAVSRPVDKMLIWIAEQTGESKKETLEAILTRSYVRRMKELARKSAKRTSIIREG